MKVKGKSSLLTPTSKLWKKKTGFWGVLYIFFISILKTAQKGFSSRRSLCKRKSLSLWPWSVFTLCGYYVSALTASHLKVKTHSGLMETLTTEAVKLRFFFEGKKLGHMYESVFSITACLSQSVINTSIKLLNLVNKCCFWGDSSKMLFLLFLSVCTQNYWLPLKPRYRRCFWDGMKLIMRLLFDPEKANKTIREKFFSPVVLFWRL